VEHVFHGQPVPRNAAATPLTARPLPIGSERASTTMTPTDHSWNDGSSPRLNLDAERSPSSSNQTDSFDDDIFQPRVFSRNRFQIQNVIPPEPPAPRFPEGELSFCELNCELLTMKTGTDTNLHRYLDAGGVVYPNVIVPLTTPGASHVVPTLKKEAGYLSSFFNRSSTVNEVPIEDHENAMNDLLPSNPLCPRRPARIPPQQSDDNSMYHDPACSSADHPTDSASSAEATTSAPTDATTNGTAASSGGIGFLSKLTRWLFSDPAHTSTVILGPAEQRISAFGWHPYQSLVAVGVRDGSVRLMQLGAQPQWDALSLQHAFQNAGVYSLAWRPFAGRELATGCASGGVCIWRIVRAGGRQSTARNAWCRYLRTSASDVSVLESGLQWARTTGIQLGLPLPVGSTSTENRNHGAAQLPPVPCTTLAWSPCGRLLAAGSPGSDALMVWDVALQTPVVLSRAGGVTLLRWSPNGHYLLAATRTNVFRVWQTQTWTCEKWTDLHTPVAAACWSADSRFLLVAPRGESTFYTVRFEHAPPTIQARFTRADDIGAYSVTYPSTERRALVGGPIRDMAWDPSGNRLVITFEEAPGDDARPQAVWGHSHSSSSSSTGDSSHHSTNRSAATTVARYTADDGEVPLSDGRRLLAVFATSLASFLDLTPLGYLRGPPNAGYPRHIEFRPVFERGALLGVCWDSGKISFYPFYFHK